jgi:hypothetical protein
MSRSPEVPSEATVIRTYADLDAETAAFFGDKYELLIVIGRPGLGKTEAMKKYLALTPGIGHLISGKASALEAYKECHTYVHRLLIFNDAEVLWNNDNGKTLMRALTEHVHEKTLQWLTSSKLLGTCPPRFTTTSRSAFVMNRFVSSGDPFYAAILDRGQLLYFDPVPLEIHTYVAEWFHDQEVHDFVGQHLHHVVNLSARAYNLTAEKKAAGRDWKRFFKDRYCNASSEMWLVQKLVNDQSFATQADRIKEFIAQTGKCKKTYYNYRDKLAWNGQLRFTAAPVIQCQGEPPKKFDRLGLIKQHEAAQATPATGDDDEQDATAKDKKDTRGKSKHKTPAKPATPKKSVLDDADLEEEPLDVPETKPVAKKKASGKKPVAKKKAGKNTSGTRPKAKKVARGRATERRRPSGKQRKRKDDSQRSACTAADIPHFLTLYTPAKCKV